MPRSPRPGDRVGPFDPFILLLGCRPWPPPPEPSGRCPVCRGGTAGDRRDVICGHCHATSPTMGRQVRRQSRATRNAGAGDVAAAERRARDELAKRHPTLTERTRRQIWNGYQGSFDSESRGLSSLAKIGRDWLRSIKQEPDWSLVLDRRGKTILQFEQPEPEPVDAG